MRFEIGASARKPAAGPARLAHDLFTRCVALLSLAIAIAAMARIAGFGGFEPARFDLMPPHWRAASVMLVVFCSAAGIGLWSLASWGAVLWLVAVLLQVGMHTAYAASFGANGGLVVLLTVILAVQIALYLVVHRRELPFLSKR